MKPQESIFGSALSIAQMEEKHSKSQPEVSSFLFESSCIDTQPPLPPGAGK